jgi:hypothetical protein
MRNLARLALVLSTASLAGCGGGSTSATPDATTSAPDAFVAAPDAPPGATAVSGTIATSTTWTGTIVMTGKTTIPAGVTVTIAPGTIFHGGTFQLLVQGTLQVAGTSAAKVTMDSAAGAHWAGITVATGGTLQMTYGVIITGGIHTTGGSATITDSQMSQATGDFLTMSGGKIDVSYSAIGLEPGGVVHDTTHCDLHFGGVGNTISITHSNISTASYGLMFYSGSGAVLTHNNWFGNSIDIEPGVMGVTGDFSGGYFAKGTPAGTIGLTFTGLASARLTDAGPRP